MRFVVDASVAVKWVIAEPGSEDAVKLRKGASFVAPDLLTIESTNILWKKVRAGELSEEEGCLACESLALAGIELRPMHDLAAPALGLALALDHSAYDCIYLALAAAEKLPFITSDAKLTRKVRERSADMPLPEVSLLAKVRH